MAGNPFTVDQLIRNDEKNSLNEAIISLIKDWQNTLANSANEADRTQLELLNNLEILKTPSKITETEAQTAILPPQLHMGKLSVDEVRVLAARAQIPVHLVLCQDKYDSESYQYILNFEQDSVETLVLTLVFAGAIPSDYADVEPSLLKADWSQLPL